jgi:hypothetical protein
VVSDATLNARLIREWSKDHLTGWSRLALYQQWHGEQKTKLDGTNPKGWSLDHNVTEQAEGDVATSLAGWRSHLGTSASVIGQAVKERYRTMRGYKRAQSILKISSLIGWVRMQGADYALAELVAT